ncbi:MAG: chemotaxis protein CheW [Chloroflexi bacterium]|nr:chemotaxis protein CheW [Chloroflexota bacterium]MBV9131645.1 chemotaxis protein CheW [Chloroflexota bacterium]MBV9899428.1 chemotaxis protein CheW [Chloroflexota bacterium]
MGRPSEARIQADSAALLVRVGDRRYGLPLAAVERVLPIAAVLPMPDAGEHLLGMLNLHGSVLPVVDPHARLGLPRPGLASDHRLILLRGKDPFLLWVDEVDEVVGLDPATISDVPSAPPNAVAPRVVRLGDAIVPLLAPGALEPRTASA